MSPSPEAGDFRSRPYSERGLVVQDGPGAGAFFPFHFPVTLVGRSGGCDIRLDAAIVRPLHCILTAGTDGVALRAISKDGVRVNGRPATTAQMRDGDLLEIGPVRLRVRFALEKPVDDALVESLRIQAAAVAAQQSALTELEIRLADRETTLVRQENQLANHLETQRRQLVELQDQITVARASLREKRAAFVTLSAEQEQQLTAARRSIDERQSRVAGREKRFLRLWSLFKGRIRRKRTDLKKDRDQFAAQAEQTRQELAAERAVIEQHRQKFHGHAEIEKRKIAADWQTLREAQLEHRERQAALSMQIREQARKAKALVAAQRRQAETNRRDYSRRDELHYEIEQLETRAANARAALTLHQPETGSPTREQGQDSPSLARRANDSASCDETQIARVADALADQRLVLADQIEWLCQTRLQWERERAESLAELEVVTATLEDREAELDYDEAQLEENKRTVAALAHRIEADRIRAAADINARKAQLDRATQELSAKSREVTRREGALADLLRLWGARRTDALAILKAAQQENETARDEWAALRENWLRSRVRLINEEHEVAARQIAVEQYRQECIDAADRPDVAARRLERLRKQWHGKCAAASREFDRLAIILKAESDQLDHDFGRIQREAASNHARKSDLDELYAAAEQQMLYAAAERARAEEQEVAQRAEQELYERELADLRDQLERLARLFIDVPVATDARAA